MANININRNNPDQFYRYKMPRLIAKVEGKGNGIKTVIVNMHEIAKALERPATYPTKFFGCELGAQTQFDLKNDRYIVNGSHDAAKLQDLLDGFIKRFVLCPECDNPETKLSVQAKKGMIVQRCIACGNQNNLDMRHKLTTFILKNPPGSELGGTAAATPNKKDKRSKRGSKSKESDAVNENGDGNRSPEVTEHDHDLDLIEAEDSSLKNGKHEKNADDDWGDDIDVSDAAIQKRMESLSSAAKSLALTDDVEKTPQQRMDMFYEYVKNKKESNTVATSGAELLAEAERLEVKEKAPIILAELLFDENILTQIKTYRNILLRFTHENPKAQKYLLGGFEQLVGNVHKEVLLPKVPHILKVFYDLDILDEEVIIEWDKKVSKKYVSKEVSKEIHEKAAMLIKWLKEADEEESSSEEEVEVVYSTTKKVGVETVKPAKTANNTTAAHDEEEEDDIDIDAI